MQGELVKVIRHPQNTIMMYWSSRKYNSLNAFDGWIDNARMTGWPNARMTGWLAGWRA